MLEFPCRFLKEVRIGHTELEPPAEARNGKTPNPSYFIIFQKLRGKGEYSPSKSWESTENRE